MEDAGGSDYRLANVLGNAREVFAATFYRGVGIAWLLKVLEDDFDPGSLDTAEGMDNLQVEFVLKRDLVKEDVALLKRLAFQPAKRGRSWPQFRSTTPGWHPWHINQAEADLLLADFPRLIAFCRLFQQHPSLFRDQSSLGIPFLTAKLPGRPLVPGDLDWRPCLRLPEAPLSAFQPDPAEIEALKRMKRNPGSVLEFDATLMPGASIVEEGRPCFGRMVLMVDTESGFVINAEIKPGYAPQGETTGSGFVTALSRARALPSRVNVRNPRWRPLLEGVCGDLGIEIQVVKRLPMLEEAFAHFEQCMRRGR